MKVAQKKSPADVLFEHRNDVGEWSEEAVSGDVRLGKTSVVSCRMPTAELDALETSARATGETISDYIRRAVALRRAWDTFGVRVPGIASSYGPSTQFVVAGAFAAFAGWSRVEDSQDTTLLVTRG